MKAVLLAAGLGTRLRPLTGTVPKCLIPIGGYPLLEFWFEYLTAADIGPFLINTHYLPDQVRRYIAGSRYRDHVTIVHEPMLLGTGGTLLTNRAFFGRESVLVAHADNLCLCNLRAFAYAHEHRPAQSAMSMMTFVTDSPELCGIVELDSQSLVVSFQEKRRDPRGNLANGAVYILEPEVIDYMEGLRSEQIDFSTEVLPHFVGRIHAWRNDHVHHDIGTPHGLSAARQSLTRRELSQEQLPIERRLDRQTIR